MQSQFDPKEIGNLGHHFPKSEIDPGLNPLAMGNAVWRNGQRQAYEPQQPHSVVHTCGVVPPEVVYSSQRLGEIFGVSAPGLRRSEEHLASLVYPYNHCLDSKGSPTARALDFVVHECIRNSVCRILLPGVHREVSQQSGYGPRLSPTWAEGLARIDMPNISDIPHGDMLHARATAAQLLFHSPRIHELVRTGEVLLMETFYDNSTGKARHYSFLTSSDSAYAVPREVLIALDRGEPIKDLASIHPTLPSVRALNFGNDVHVANFHPPVPTEFIVSSCADSRVSPHILFHAPYGYLEVIRNAGNVINEAAIESFALAASFALKAKRDAGLPEKVRLVVLTHTQCGAVTATLNSLSHAHESHEHAQSADQPDPAGPIIRSLRHRFGAYRKAHPDYTQSDPLLADAAEANAVGAVLDILRARSSAADQLRAWLSGGERSELEIIPASYDLQHGIVRFFPQLPLGE